MAITMIRRFIIRKVENTVEQFLKAISEIINRYGVKSVVAIAGIYTLGELVKSGHVPGLVGGISIGVIAVAFFVARHLEHKQELEAGVECTCEEDK